MDGLERMEDLRRLRQIAEKFCNVRFVMDKDEKDRDELRVWITHGTQIWNIPIGVLSDPEIVRKAYDKLEGHVGAGVCGTRSEVEYLKKMFDQTGGCWKMELHRLYVVLDATSVGYRRAWSRCPEGVYELLNFFRTGDVGVLPRGINWAQYPCSVEWTSERDIP